MVKKKKKSLTYDDAGRLYYYFFYVQEKTYVKQIHLKPAHMILIYIINYMCDDVSVCCLFLFSFFCCFC